MNNCILVAEIAENPQLRYTSDTQLEVTEMLVQFDGLRQGDPPSTLKVVAWRGLATEVQQRYRQGDRVLIEGRLSINSIEKPDGYKEKRAELVAQRIYTWASDEAPLEDNPHAAKPASAPVAAPAAPAAPAASAPPPQARPQTAPPTVSQPLVQYDEPLQDEIPF